MITEVYRGAGVFDRRLFAKIGEFRKPKAGEFFLSGAIPEVYDALHDLSTDYHIMREVEELPHNPVYKFKKER
jgi:hypothetical protein